MTRYDTTGRGEIGAAASVSRGASEVAVGCETGTGIATTTAPPPAGIGVHTWTPAISVGITAGFGRGATAWEGAVAPLAATVVGWGGAADHAENTCRR